MLWRLWGFSVVGTRRGSHSNLLLTSPLTSPPVAPSPAALNHRPSTGRNWRSLFWAPVFAFLCLTGCSFVPLIPRRSPGKAPTSLSRPLARLPLPEEPLADPLEAPLGPPKACAPLEAPLGPPKVPHCAP